MIIAVDEVIPYAREAFASLGEVRWFSGRNVRAHELKEAEAIVFRSITRADASLLDGSAARFVGTASIGMDHFDLPYLERRGIHYTNAAGSNANSVAEYLTAALLFIAERRGWSLSRKALAIVGAGHVGSRVEQKARALGLSVMLCDPPLRDSTEDSKYRALEDVLAADIITLHTPLTRTGLYPTYHMFDEKVLAHLSSKQYLINTARGSVINGRALKDSLRAGRIEGASLDVWEGEPSVDFELADLADLATPHIAGYSLDGKVQGTQMILDSLCRNFKLTPSWHGASVYPRPKRIRPGAGESNFLASIVRQAYDIRKDDSDLRALPRAETGKARSEFDRLRNEYHYRPEFSHYIVELDQRQSELAQTLQDLGFLTEMRCP